MPSFVLKLLVLANLLTQKCNVQLYTNLKQNYWYLVLIGNTMLAIRMCEACFMEMYKRLVLHNNRFIYINNYIKSHYLIQYDRQKEHGIYMYIYMGLNALNK